MSSIDGPFRDLDDAADPRKAAQDEVRAATDALVRHVWFTSVVAGVTVGPLFALVVWLFL